MTNIYSIDEKAIERQKLKESGLDTNEVKTLDELYKEQEELERSFLQSQTQVVENRMAM